MTTLRLEIASMVKKFRYLEPRVETTENVPEEGKEKDSGFFSKLKKSIFG